jgi:hypothetical protein
MVMKGLHNMAYGDYGNHVRGKKAEISFMETSISLGWNWYNSDDHEDKVFHIDCHVKKPNDSRSIDVKSIKKDNKGVFNRDCTYVELVTTKGKIGWLFGRANWFAFEYDYEGTFLVISQEDLIDVVFNHPPCINNILSRQGLKDRFVKIHTDFIKERAEIWERR